MAPKKKTEKMSLGTFLQDENYGSWADEMEDMPLPSTENRPTFGSDRRNYDSGRDRGMGGGMGMGMGNGYERRDGFPPRESLPLPTQPPYTAHLANLSFDATQGDIGEFFKDCQVTNVRIVEDKLDRKPKGFGYVEFATLDGLKTALSLSSSNLGGRSIRVSVAEPPKDRQDSRDFSDWSRKGPLPELPGAGSQRRVSDRPSFGGNRNFDNMSDAGSERGNRRGYEAAAGDGKVRDFSNWERRGPLSPTTPGGGTSLRDGGRQGSKDTQPSFRKNSPAWGEGTSQDGSRPPRREYAEKPQIERQPTAPELDNQWRARMRPDAPAKSPTPETSAPPSPAPAAAALPATRPKLNLQKRTVSEADPGSSLAATADSKASPFGAARPVDTATKEKEVEEKRQIAIRQKREADEKARAERAEEKRSARDKPEQEKPTEVASKAPKETPSTTEEPEEPSQPSQPAPKFDILRRAESGTNDMVADEENDEETEPQLSTEDREVKPKEIYRDPPKSGGAQRNGQAADSAPDTTATNMDEDGWSTVSKPTKQRNNRRNNMPARALAS